MEELKLYSLEANTSVTASQPIFENYIKGATPINHTIKAGDRKVLYVLPQNSTNIYLSSRNLQQVNVTSVDEISTYTIMNANTLVLIDGVQDTLAERNLR